MITYSYYNRSYMHETRKSRAMNNNQINDTLQELRKPFHPSHVTWKPGMLSKDQGKALALAYADLRAYQNRLDEVCGMDWSVTYTPWGERIVCHLTIQGVTRSSSGEPDSQSERSEIAGTAAEAQAFKRACAMFGLGRYLYNLPSVWVEYDLNTKHFTEKAKTKLESIIVQHYRRTVKETNEESDQGRSLTVQTLNGERTDEMKEAVTEVSEVTEHVQNSAEAQHEAAEATLDEPLNDDALSGRLSPEVTVVEPLRQQFNELGQELYGEQWSQVSRHNVERITGGKANESGSLTTEQIQKLVDGMKKLQRRRRTVVGVSENGHAVAA